jgi:hypothetical protein
MLFDSEIEKILCISQEVVCEVQYILKHGAPNRLENWLEQTRRGTIFEFLGAIAKFQTYRHFFDQNFSRIYGRDLAFEVSKQAIFMKSGNCYEHSALAFSLLYAKNIKCVEWVKCIGKDHSFVLIGRIQGQSESIVDGWGKTIVCDAWSREVFICKSRSDLIGKYSDSYSYIVIGSVM